MRDIQIVSDALIAGKFGGVTAHTVVNKVFSTALQRVGIGKIRLHGVTLDSTATKVALCTHRLNGHDHHDYKQQEATQHQGEWQAFRLDPLRLRQRFFAACPKRHTNKISEVNQCADLSQDRASRSRRFHAEITENDEGCGKYQERNPAKVTLVANGLNRALIQPWQNEEDGNRRTHRDQAQKFGVQWTNIESHCTQDGVERREVPDRGNVLRGLQVIRFFKVRILKEEPAHFRHEKQHKAENKQEYCDTHQIVHGVKRMERNAIQWNTVFIFVLLDFHTVGIVGTHLMQRQQMQHHQGK